MGTILNGRVDIFRIIMAAVAKNGLSVAADLIGKSLGVRKNLSAATT
jgi:hypothetical protein